MLSEKNKRITYVAVGLCLLPNMPLILKLDHLLEIILVQEDNIIDIKSY